MRTKKATLLGMILLLVVLLGACAAPLPTPAPTPAPQPVPTDPEPEPEPIANKGEIIMDGAVVVGGDLESIILVDKITAVNPTFAELRNFLASDKTDSNDYILSFATRDRTPSYVCADFAEAIHNNAEASGIKAGFVVFDEIDHALNAFQTIDKGLIFIDSTGQFFIHTVTPPWEIAFGEPIIWDKIAYVQKGKALGFIELGFAPYYGFEYSGYERWLADKALFDSKFNKYKGQVGGRESVSLTEYNRLKEQERELKEIAGRLGGFFEEKGIVQGFQIFWEGR